MSNGIGMFEAQIGGNVLERADRGKRCRPLLCLTQRAGGSHLARASGGKRRQAGGRGAHILVVGRPYSSATIALVQTAPCWSSGRLK